MQREALDVLCRGRAAAADATVTAYLENARGEAERRGSPTQDYVRAEIQHTRTDIDRVAIVHEQHLAELERELTEDEREALDRLANRESVAAIEPPRPEPG